MKLQTKGRLSKRFKASRSISKFKHKGSLKYLEAHKEKDNVKLLKSPSVFKLRGNLNPNIQHTYIQKTRRIGVFGVKG